LTLENVTPAGFNYHLISVFGSQSTGKSTLLNHLFGTQFSVMSELERRQTTKGIWLSNNKKQGEAGAEERMADNILVMDVEGTDGRERGEDQDFERKSALFALATSEVLIVNIWEHQVGLYQGANMGLLKTVFEVNLQLFLKDKQYVAFVLIYAMPDPGANRFAVLPTALSFSSSFVISSVRHRSKTFRRHYWKTCPVCGRRYRSLLGWRTPRSMITLTSNSTDSRIRDTSQTSL
jgi:hypothetical protein